MEFADSFLTLNDVFLIRMIWFPKNKNIYIKDDIVRVIIKMYSKKAVWIFKSDKCVFQMCAVWFPSNKSIFKNDKNISRNDGDKYERLEYVHARYESVLTMLKI